MHPNEPTALMQRAGGPCGVLAPVQGYILKELLHPAPHFPRVSNWRQPDAAHVPRVLVRALANILLQAAAVTGGPVVIVSEGTKRGRRRRRRKNDDVMIDNGEGRKEKEGERD